MASTSASARITVEQAAWELEAGHAVFVDVRNYLAYERSHIPGAISIPLMELGQRLHELPKDRLLVFY